MLSKLNINQKAAKHIIGGLSLIFKNEKSMAYIHSIVEQLTINSYQPLNEQLSTRLGAQWSA